MGLTRWPPSFLAPLLLIVRFLPFFCSFPFLYALAHSVNASLRQSHFHKMSWRLHLSKIFLLQQQSSSSSSNRFIEHNIATRKLRPSSGIRPSFLNRPIYTFMLLCLGVARHRLKLFWKMLSRFSKFLVVCAVLRSSCVETASSVMYTC